MWLTVDRSQRVAQLFTPLQEAVARLADVKFVIRDEWTIEQLRAEAFKPMLDPVEANEYDLIFSDAVFAFPTEQWDKILTRKAVLMEDQHGPLVKQYITNATERDGFDVVFTRYWDATYKQWPHLFSACDLFRLPHCFDPLVFRLDSEPYDLRSIPALMTGRVNSDIYPHRYAMHEALKQEPYYTRVLRPEEGANAVGPRGAAYAALLRSAKIALQGKIR